MIKKTKNDKWGVFEYNDLISEHNNLALAQIKHKIFFGYRFKFSKYRGQ